jgi:Replication initiator protein A/DnaA N-terminal domain
MLGKLEGFHRKDGALTRRDKRKKTAKATQSLVRAETNLEIYPMFKITGRNRDATPYVYEKVTQAEDGLELRKIWKVVPSGEYGSPGGKDQDVFVAVLELLERTGGMPADGEIETSPNELLGILGKADSGKNYRELKESLLRIHHTGIESRDAFFSKETESYVTDGFEIWKVKIIENKRKADGRTTSRVKIKFHDLFIRSFVAHYLKGLDTEFYWTLNSYLSKRLYRLIDQMRGTALEWDEDLFELQKQLPLAGYQYVSKIKQVLDPAHFELREKGFLENVWYDEDDRVNYSVSETFARRRAAFELSGSPEEFIAIERLLSEGVRGDVARSLVAKHGAKRCLRCADALPFQSGIRNRAGWLRKAIEEGYELGPTLTSEAHPSAASPKSPVGVKRGGEGEKQTSCSTTEPRAEEVWKSLLEELSQEINSPSLHVWFEGAIPTSFEDATLMLEVPNAVAKQYIEERFGEIMRGVLREQIGTDAEVEIKCWQDNECSL